MAMGHYHWNPPAGVTPSLLAAAYFRVQRGWKSQKIQNPFWVLDFTVEAMGQVRVGSSRAPWRARNAGVAHLYPPGTPYWEDTTAVTGWTTTCFASFGGGEAAALLEWTHNKYNYARFLDDDGRIPACIQTMTLAGRQHGEHGFWMAQAGLSELLHVIRQASPVDAYTYRVGPGTERSVSDMVRRTQEYVRARFHAKIRLADLAEHLHMSPSAFSHRFRAETGQSPMAALTEYRIQVARSLLLRGQTLAEIAAKTGFHDAYHLSKTFKKVLGASPRDMIRGTAATPTPDRS